MPDFVVTIKSIRYEFRSVKAHGRASALKKAADWRSPGSTHTLSLNHQVRSFELLPTEEWLVDSEEMFWAKVKAGKAGAGKVRDA